ncbi:YfbM family protein [Nocardia sp. NPDC058705]|uniref:YfbM family protein n=1 Tax=Nocardia sp. NPDC058705 TaxID=3346609 RepID=UPI0036A4849C
MGPVLAFHRISDEDAARITADAEAAFDLIDAIDRTGEPAGDIDKAWDGLRYLLEAAGIDLDLIRDLDPWAGDGEPRVWTADEVSTAARTMTSTPFAVLDAHFDPEVMDDNDVCPDIWDTDFSRDFLREHYEGLRSFLTFAAEKNSPVLTRFE